MGAIEFHRGLSGRILPGPALDLDGVEAKLRAFFSRTTVVLAYLYGSYAQGEVKSSSDVDIAVLLEGRGEELYARFRELILGIRDALDTERSDLLFLNGASPAMRFAAVSTGRLLFARSEPDLNSFEEGAIPAYQDTAHLRAVQSDYLRRRARGWSSATRA